MKKDKLGSVVFFVSILAAFLASLVFSAQSSAISEEARTLQMIAPYRTWGKANVRPIVLSTDNIATGG